MISRLSYFRFLHTFKMFQHFLKICKIVPSISRIFKICNYLIYIIFFQHAGVAITITSLTDIVAFAIGGTTILPALRFFCLYASIGIAAIYVFQCTFFLACLCLDQVYLISILFSVFYHQGSFKFCLEIRF